MLYTHKGHFAVIWFCYFISCTSLDCLTGFKNHTEFLTLYIFKKSRMRAYITFQGWAINNPKGLHVKLGLLWKPHTNKLNSLLFNNNVISLLAY